MKQYLVLAFCTTFVLLTSGCTLSYPLEYTVHISDCNRSLTDGYYKLNRTRWDSFVLNYTRSYYCEQSELRVSAFFNQSKIIVTEELFVGTHVTGCTCPRMITVVVRHLRHGNYTIEVRDYNYMKNRKPVFTQDITV